MKNFPRLAGRLLALLLVLGGLSLSSCKSSDTTTVYGNWTIGNGFIGVARSSAVVFVINNVAYVGTGIDVNSAKYKDFYAYAPRVNTWSVVTPMPAAAAARYNAVAFSAAGKGYVGTGIDVNGNYLNDFWQFDPTVNTTTTTTTATGATSTTTTIGSWQQIDNLPVIGRHSAIGGSVSDIGYVGCGYDGNYQKDFYKYTPGPGTTGKWSTFASFPGNKRIGGVAFTVNSQMYIGTGINNGAYQTDFWSYNPAADRWSQLRNLANQTTGDDTYDYSAVARAYAAAFTVGNYAFLTVGSNSSVRTDCYVYDSTQDTWTLKNPFLGAGRNSPVAFGIDNIGYVGTGTAGSSSSSTRNDDFWKFFPDDAQQ